MPYECSTCGKKFSKSSGLATHVLIHSGEKPFKCQKCGTSFRQSGHLKRHELIHDRKGVNVEQLQTSESQTRACTELTIDSSGKRRKSYRCPYCSKLFGHSSNLSKHKRIHTGVKPFSCFMCGTAFTDQTTLRRHVQSNSCKQSFICQLCNIKFVQYEYYKNHVCRPPGDDTSTQPVKTRRKRRAVRQVYAANDEMTLNTKNAEQSSLEIGPRQHQQPDDERLHATATVEGDDGNVDDDDDDDVSRDDKTKCQDSSTTDAGCSEAEANDDPLRPVDLRVDHCDGDDDDDGTGGGCSALNSRPAESSLTAPVTIREGVSSDISCPHCLRQFTLVSSLRRHLLTHTDQRPYECQLCDKSFALPSYLREHQRTHGLGQLLNCPYCDKTFNKPRRLLYHVRTHTGEKPYVCKFCDRRFPQPNGLEIHVRTHTGAKRFKCGECGKMFSQSSNLTTHIKRHMKTANAINVNGDVIKRLVDDDDDDDSDVRTATTDADVVVTKNSVLSSKYNERDVKVGDDSDDEQQEVIDVTSADKLLRTDSGRPSLVVKTELGSNGSDDNAKVAFTSQRYVELN